MRVVSFHSWILGLLVCSQVSNITALPKNSIHRITPSISDTVISNGSTNAKKLAFPFLRSIPRGGNADTQDAVEEATTVEGESGKESVSLEDKVQAAMRKFGMKSSTDNNNNNDSNDDSNDMNCEGGVCKAPDAESTPIETEEEKAESLQEIDDNVEEIATRIASDLNVDEGIAMSALYASATAKSPTASMEDPSNFIYNEEKAREIIQYEIDAVKEKVPDDSTEVKTLIDEGFDSTMVKRALALTDMNMDDARAVLIAEQEDEEAELQEQKEAEAVAAAATAENAPAMKEISVNANFDPTAPSGDVTAPSLPAVAAGGAASTKPEIYQCTTSEVQKVILESPIPVLLDIYADWCGPCKQLTPALEDMCIKSNGLFRLVKVNADEEKGLVSSVLAVTGYPTLFGIRNGKIINRKVGGPQSEEEFRSFMMKIVSGHDEEGEFEEMTTKLVKMAGAAALPFSQRERIQTMTQSNLAKLLESDCNNDMFQAEKCVKMLRTLLSKVITEPYSPKFRKVNLSHPALQIVKNCPSSTRILKTAGFQKHVVAEDVWTMNEDKAVINIAPLSVVRDQIDKWMDVNRYEIAKAASKAKEDQDREKLKQQMEEEEDEYDEEDEEEIEEVDPNLCLLKVRLDGKKQVHDVEFDGDDLVGDTMKALVTKLIGSENEEEVQLVCASKRLIVNASDESMMKKSLKEIGIFPSASIVLKVVHSNSSTEQDEITQDSEQSARKSSIAERAKAKKRKTGSHTMQSIGIYAKDDNAKAELIDGGGGVWYEHDISDDEEENEDVENENESKKDELDNVDEEE